MFGQDLTDNNAMEGGVKILYIGQDLGFWQDVRERYESQYPGLEKKFFSFFESESAKVQALIYKIYTLNPDIIYLDFSKNTADYLHLARIMRRTHFFRKKALVALLDYRLTHESENIIMAGVRVIQIKSGELHDVVYHGLSLLSSDLAEAHAFATAMMNDQVMAYEYGRVGYVSKDLLHVETSRVAAKGDKIECLTEWGKKDIFKSAQFTVLDVGQNNLFYHYKNFINLKPDYAPVAVKEEFEADEKFEVRKKAAEKLLKQSRERFHEWVNDHGRKSTPKCLSTLILDRALGIYLDEKKTDEYPYVIRCKPYLMDVDTEISALKPQLIVISLDEGKSFWPGEEEKTQLWKACKANQFPEILPDLPPGALANSMATLNSIKAAIGKHPKYEPFLLIFNSPKSTEDLQKEIKYNKLMSVAQGLSFSFLKKAFESFSKKLDGACPTTLAYPEDAVFLGKNDPLSIIRIGQEVKLLSISESDCIIGSNTVIPPYTCFTLLKPMPLMITTIPLSGPGSAGGGSTMKYTYKALIHNCGEVEKKSIRHFVNEVFFRELQAQKEAEREEALKTQDSYLQKKADQAAEEAAKAAAEAEADKDKDAA